MTSTAFSEIVPWLSECVLMFRTVISQSCGYRVRSANSRTARPIGTCKKHPCLVGLVYSYLDCFTQSRNGSRFD